MWHIADIIGASDVNMAFSCIVKVKATIPLTRRTLTQSRRGHFIHKYL